MPLKLKDIASINVGLLLSRKKATLKDEAKFNYKVVSLKSFNDDAIYLHEFAENFIANENLKQYLVQKDDILVRLREPNFAIYIDKDYQDLIYPSMVAKIKVINKSFDPFFIAHYLNSSIVKRELLKDISGTSIPTINVKSLENITIPNIKNQSHLVEYLKLSSKNTQILEKLLFLNKIFQKGVLENAAKKGL